VSVARFSPGPPRNTKTPLVGLDVQLLGVNSFGWLFHLMPAVYALDLCIKLLLI
jgi:hypothetical protein